MHSFCFAVFTMGSDKKAFLISQNIMSECQDNKPLIHKESFLLLGSATEYHVKKMLMYWMKMIIPLTQLL